MTSTDGYATGTALWRAVTDRAKAAAQITGGESGALVRRFVFGRFLARVFADPSTPWVLKGGTAVLARVHDARTTKDVDLLHQLVDIDAAVEALRAATRTDLADHFRFVITAVGPNVGGQPEVVGARVTVDAYCGAVRRDVFGVDLVTGALMTSTPEALADTVLDVRGIEAPTMRLYPVVDHIADKLCATQAMYGTDGERPSSRVRDLVDLVVLARSQDVDGSALITAVHSEWTHRSLPGAPVFAPPAGWARRYPPEARKTPAVADLTVFADAVALVGGFLAPVLDGRAAGLRWVATELSWR
ncbi:MAG TPA: nucleotidyl transferase AbiEii/AbiGii toxin family protein [Cellulomonas sp.]